jgi:hypothetical protein
MQEEVISNLGRRCEYCVNFSGFQELLHVNIWMSPNGNSFCYYCAKNCVVVLISHTLDDVCIA